ncbi:MAG: phosphoethanolamine transferase CptA [Ignavibacteria bacterium]|nr:phosphoethanolamine transferase CptA [Ignavibacteria bacterium]
MGEIVFWALIRTAVLILFIWGVEPYMDYSVWWMMSMLLIYAVVLHPIVIQYQIFMHKNKPVFEDTLCSSCEHFEHTAVLCMKHDEHPTKEYLPCDGLDWSPKPAAKQEEIE